MQLRLSPRLITAAITLALVASAGSAWAQGYTLATGYGFGTQDLSIRKTGSAYKTKLYNGNTGAATGITYVDSAWVVQHQSSTNVISGDTLAPFNPWVDLPGFALWEHYGGTAPTVANDSFFVFSLHAATGFDYFGALTSHGLDINSTGCAMDSIKITLQINVGGGTWEAVATGMVVATSWTNEVSRTYNSLLTGPTMNTNVSFLATGAEQYRFIVNHLSDAYYPIHYWVKYPKRIL